jgi:hypothetical protein
MKQVASRASCYLLNAGFLLGLFFQLEDGETCYSETPVHFQRIAQRYIVEDKTLPNHRCEKLRSYDLKVCDDGILKTNNGIRSYESELFIA